MSVIVVESLVMAVLAVMFAAVWLRSREPGTWLLAIGFAVAAGWYHLSDLAPNTGEGIDTLPERVSAIAVGIAILLRTGGVALYLRWPRGAARHVVVGCSLPAVACLALLTLPLLPFALGFAGVPPDQLKHCTGIPVIVFGMLVLTVSLLRRHRALMAEVARRVAAQAQLRDANQRLEARVVERTAHLHELIGGLEPFTRGVSHDLRGPLGGMSQLAHTAADAMARGDATLARRALPLIASQCDASVKMVNAMLELVRVGEVVASSFDEVRHGSLRCGAMPASLQADPVLMRTALVNLIGNAVKFSSEADEPQVEVDAAVEGRDVIVHVRDNGSSFPAELAPRLFEPFFRAPGAQPLGHGLGLSIARRAAEATGGRIGATAQPGQGAQIGFRLAVALRDPTPAPALAPAT